MVEITTISGCGSKLFRLSIRIVSIYSVYAKHKDKLCLQSIYPKYIKYKVQNIIRTHQNTMIQKKKKKFKSIFHFQMDNAIYLTHKFHNGKPLCYISE